MTLMLLLIREEGFWMKKIRSFIFILILLFIFQLDVNAVVDYKIVGGTGIYYENLELSSYLCIIKDIDIYMKNIEDKDTLKRIKKIINKKINKYSKMYYINPILLNNIIKKPITYIRQKTKKL